MGVKGAKSLALQGGEEVSNELPSPHVASRFLARSVWPRVEDGSRALRVISPLISLIRSGKGCGRGLRPSSWQGNGPPRLSPPSRVRTWHRPWRHMRVRRGPDLCRASPLGTWGWPWARVAIVGPRLTLRSFLRKIPPAPISFEYL